MSSKNSFNLFNPIEDKVVKSSQ